MEKLRFINGEELELVPVSTFNVNDKFGFKVTSELSYSDFEILVLQGVLQPIHHIGESGEIIGTYSNTVALNYITKDYEKNIYAVEYSTNPTVATLHRMNETLSELQLQNEMLTDCVLELSSILFSEELLEEEDEEEELPTDEVVEPVPEDVVEEGGNE